MTAARLNIHLYTQSWNEAAMLGFFFRHYDPWISRYVVYDDGSTDGTLDLLAAHPRVEIRRFERVVPDSFVRSAKRLHNSHWQESRGKADWVVVTAIDEHLHHPDLMSWLEAQHSAGVTLIPALGYQMVAQDFPPPDAHLATTLTQGAHFDQMNKLSLFRPDALTATGYGNGRHRAAPRGRLVLPERDLLLLQHYKYLGYAYVKRRQALLAQGLGETDRVRGWGAQYLRGADGVDRDLRRFLGRAFNIADPAHDHHVTHPAPRWWRPG